MVARDGLGGGETEALGLMEGFVTPGVGPILRIFS